MKKIILAFTISSSFCLSASLSARPAAEDLKDAAFSRPDAQQAFEFPEPSLSLPPDVAAIEFDLCGIFGRLMRIFPAALQRYGGASLYSVILKPLANIYLKPDAFFTTGKGTRVYVSGNESVNCPDGGYTCKDREKSFVILTTDKNETFFVRGMDIAVLQPIYNGSKTVVIDGEKYTLRLYANTSVPGNSRLEIKGPSGVIFTSTLQKLGDAAALKGVDIALSKNYKLAYGNELVQGPKGASFTEKMMVYMILYPVDGNVSYFAFGPDELSPNGSSFPSFEPAYGFRLSGGALEIYKL